MPKGAKRFAWRDYLSEKYAIEDRNARAQMHYQIRKRARRMARDLLLICKSSVLSEKDRYEIFKTEEMLERVTKPLIDELVRSVWVWPSDRNDFKIVQTIVMWAEMFAKEYDLKRLVEDAQYRDRMWNWVITKINKRMD